MHEVSNAWKREKANRALILSILSLGLFGLSLWLTCFLSSTLDAIFGSVLLFIPSIVLQCKSEKKERYSLYSLILNSVANGLIVAIYYLKIQRVPELCDFSALLLPGALVLLAYLLFGYLQKGRAWFCILLILLHIALMVGAVIRWIQFSNALYSLTFFSLIFSMIYTVVFAVSIHQPARSVLRGVSKGSFGILGILTIVVLFLITEGEGIDSVFEGLGELVSDILPDRKKTML